MACTLTSLFVHPYQLTTSYSATVTDSAGTRTATVNASGSHWFQAALGGGAGTSTSPYELPSVLRTALGATWTVALTSGGFVRITYAGTGTGTISGSGIYPILRLLGFQNPGAISLSAGASTTATRHPVGAIFTVARASDTGLEATSLRSALARTQGGVVYGVAADGFNPVVRSQLLYVAKDWSYYDASLFPGTPMWASSDSSGVAAWLSPPRAATIATAGGAESITRWLQEARTLQVSAVLGWLPDVLAGTRTDWLNGYVTEDTFSADSLTKLSRPNWDALYDAAVGFNVVSFGGTDALTSARLTTSGAYRTTTGGSYRITTG